MTIEQFKQEYLEQVENQNGRVLTETTIREQYDALAAVSMRLIGENWKKYQAKLQSGTQKEVYYFSMEFLMGRLLTNNLMNNGLYPVAEAALAELGIDITTIESAEMDAGLGNGGLGRLAACFLDSSASLGLPVHGNTIRYQYGFFDQSIENGKQQEHVQQWLYESSYEWEVCRQDQQQIISYGGTYENGKHVPEMRVIAMPYDVPVVGFGGEIINTLRMWKAEPDTEATITGNFTAYESRLRQISSFLYPDDSDDEGQKLRLLQQYFFSSAGAQALIKNHLKKYGTLDNLHEKVTIQINDTHPTIVIPELLRIFIDEHQYTFEAAWNIISQTVAYTNHTLLAEALERWPIAFMQDLFPRLFPLIEQVNAQYLLHLKANGIDSKTMKKLAIITDTHVQMAYLAIAGSFSVNGVAQLHTDLLIEAEMKEMNRVYPNKFNNKTNGITHRRWLMYANPELSALVTETIGDTWITNLEAELPKLQAYKSETVFLEKLMAIKTIKKQQLADFIMKETGIAVDSNSIFDIQVKRLHAYKRQLLNALHILHLYLELKKNPQMDVTPRTFIFGAKAAPSYVLAKEVIYFLHVLADVINNDESINEKIKVVFIPNYNVTAAEYIFPGADISEQISTAGKEASGTGNMKFMMNGALTLGTLDGANVEIAELAGHENNFIFGMDVEAVTNLKASGTYNTKKLVAETPMFKELFAILEKPTTLGSKLVASDAVFKNILADLIERNDEYYVLADLPAYIQAQENISSTYKDKEKWAKMALANIAQSGFFTSDRTIAEYDRDIWKITK